MQLPGVGHRESEQTFHDPRQFLELIVEYTKCLAIFLRASWFREKQQGHASKAVEHSVGPKSRDGHGKNERLMSLLKGNERHAHGFSILQGSYPESRP